MTTARPHMKPIRTKLAAAAAAGIHGCGDGGEGGASGSSDCARSRRCPATGVPGLGPAEFRPGLVSVWVVQVLEDS